VLLVLPSSYYAPDYNPLLAVLERSGVQTVVACMAETAMPAALGEPVRADVALADARAADYDALCFCGGTGVHELLGDSAGGRSARRLIQEALAAGKYVTALGTGPVVLADAGALRGRDATCFKFGGPRGTYIQRLEAGGAAWLDQPVVVSGQIITGQGAEHATKFAYLVANHLNDVDTESVNAEGEHHDRSPRR
jgi:protease I